MVQINRMARELDWLKRAVVPSSKHQAPEKFQIPKSKSQTNPKTQTKRGLPGRCCLEIDDWIFSGAWSLELRRKRQAIPGSISPGCHNTRPSIPPAMTSVWPVI